MTASDPRADLEAARLAGESDAYRKTARMVADLAAAHRATGNLSGGYVRAIDDVTNGLLRLLGVKPLKELTDQLAGTVPTKGSGPRFERTYCSQCGGEFGPGDHGFSRCSSHRKSR